MFQCCRFTQFGAIGLILGITGLVAWAADEPKKEPQEKAAAQQAKPADAKAEPATAVRTTTFAIPLLRTATAAKPAADKKEEQGDTNRKHPLESANAAADSSTTIEFNNTSSQQLGLFRLTGQGQRQPYGTLPPGLTTEFPTTSGEKWLIADTKKNAIAIFIADGQPRSIEINDDQISTWKQQLAQEQIIVRGDHGETLQTFTVGSDDNIYALLAAPAVYGEVPTTKSSDASHNGEVRVYSPKGEELRRFPLDFKPHRIAVAPDGEVIVGGSGVIARYKSDGVLIDKHVPPNMTGTDEDWKKAAEQARETNIAQYKEQVASLEQSLKAMKENKEKGDAAADDQPDNSAAYTQIIKSYQEQLKTLESQSIEDAIKQLKETSGQIYALTASEDSLYAATRMTTGYGFAVWKMTRDGKDGKQIVENLSGCCGQLDIQAKGADLFVAENSRHRVLKFDADGKKLTQFGSRARGGDGDGFGGCCNPMNLCFASNGDIFTAESEGKVKCYTEGGKFVANLAAVRVSGGCKNVAVGTTKNRDRLFFLDLNGSKIVISKLSPKQEVSAPAPAAESAGGGE